MKGLVGAFNQEHGLGLIIACENSPKNRSLPGSRPRHRRRCTRTWAPPCRGWLPGRSWCWRRSCSAGGWHRAAREPDLAPDCSCLFSCTGVLDDCVACKYFNNRQLSCKEDFSKSFLCILCPMRSLIADYLTWRAAPPSPPASASAPAHGWAISATFYLVVENSNQLSISVYKQSSHTVCCTLQTVLNFTYNECVGEEPWFTTFWTSKHNRCVKQQ